MERKVLIFIAAAAVAIVLIFPTLSIIYPTDNQVVHDHADANKSIYLNGTLLNKINGKYLNGTLSIKNLSSCKTYIYNESGKYNIKLPNGSYSVNFSSPGFENKSIDLSNSTIYAAYMSSVSSIGANSTIYTGQNISSTVPYLNNSFLKSNLKNETLLKSQNIDVLLKFFNGTGTHTIKNKKFALFIKVNGNIYKYVNTTNSTGESYLPLDYAGNYTISVYFLNYRVGEKTYYIHNNKTIDMNSTYLTPNNNQLKLATYELNGASNVPASGLSIDGGIFSINYQNYTNNTGTYYNFSVPNGTYSFTYSNKYYAVKNFVENISAPSSFSKNISAYLLNITDSKSSYNYTVNNGKMYSSNQTLRETAGSYSIEVYYNGTFIGYYNLTLNKLNPAYNINISVKNRNSAINLSYTSYSKNQNITVNIFNSTNFNNPIYIYKADLYSKKYTNPYSMNIIVNGNIIYSNSTLSAQNHTFTKAPKVTGTNFTIETHQKDYNPTEKGGMIYFVSLNVNKSSMEEFK